MCGDTRPGLSAEVTLPEETNAVFNYSGFPKCGNALPVIPFDLSEVFFSEGKMYLPLFDSVLPISSPGFCVGKEYVESKEKQLLRVYTCVEEVNVKPFLFWLEMGTAYLLLLLTLLAFIIIKDLRRLQGQYMICFVISMLLYNILRVPGSVLLFQIEEVPCIILGVLKCFFFSCMIAWLSVICMEIWITLHRMSEKVSWRRFMQWSMLAWGLGIVMTGGMVAIFKFSSNYNIQESCILRAVREESCKLPADMDWVLLLMVLTLLVTDLVILLLATLKIRKYYPFENYGDLNRSEACLCLKQGWKLFIIVVITVLINFPEQLFDTTLESQLILLLQSAAIFGVLIYRKIVMRTLKCCCNCVLPFTRRDLLNCEELQQDRIQL
ncbi:hypothetical protein Pcinc_032847 [Petrolisthes cinctipes]|uniref:G-protein coupled receptors family 2 profile 2 domain-containing protein n=1 Tax=Petrolisthes cinctipes TaxID=88211 RepID=A0AAE1K2D6_PETCI|nr:hypothetical protein Pcinc_032847 [Petrolisthes cinctipes]